MPELNWRSPEAYYDLRSLDAPGFAWQYLSRNPDFRRDQKRLAQLAQCNELTAEHEASFARRWGVRFPAKFV
jgi:hypothetical protein